MAWKVIVSPSANADLANIVAYISRRNAPAAERLGNLLIDRAESIARFPEIGRTVPEYKNKLLREIHGPFLSCNLPCSRGDSAHRDSSFLARRSWVSYDPAFGPMSTAACL